MTVPDRAFLRRWTEVQGAVQTFLLAATRDRHAADDLLQETAIALLEADGDYDPERPFLAWAIGVAKHQAQRWYRARARQRTAPIDGMLLDLLADAAADTEQDEVRERRLAQLRQCLAELGGRAWDAIRLHYGEGLDQSEAGARLGLADEHLRVVLHRARRSLRNCVERRLAEQG